jgi:hypothetical protein
VKFISTDHAGAVLSALGEEFLVDVPADHNDGYKIDYDTLSEFLTHPPEGFLDRLVGYANTKD